MATITPATKDLLDRLRSTPEMPDVYLLGYWESPVSIAAQQRRAFNLIWALHSSTPGLGAIGVVGGGIAGVTVAAACRLRRIRVQLYEQAPQLCGDQIANTQRFVHPHITEWPWEKPRTQDAGLPHLNWEADWAGNVAAAVLRGFRDLFDMAAEEPRMLNQKISHVQQPPGHRPQVVLEGIVKHSYDAVVIATGFGEDRPLRDFEPQPYWRLDAVPSRRRRPEEWLIAGCGDGGLVDTFRAALAVDHRELTLETLTRADDRGLHASLRAIELEAHTRELDGQERGHSREQIAAELSEYLWAAYRTLTVPLPLVQYLVTKRRPDIRVTVAIPTPHPMTLNACIFNRFLGFVLFETFRDEIRYQPGRLPHPAISTKAFPVRLNRTGQEPSYTKLNERIPRNRRPARERTDIPLWGGGFFDPPRGVTVSERWVHVEPADRAKAILSEVVVSPLLEPLSEEVRSIRQLWSYRSWTRRVRRRRLSQAIDALMGFLVRASVSTGRLAPGDAGSLQDFRVWYLKNFLARRREILREAVGFDLSGDLCSIGGPVDHALTRFAMGYDRSGLHPRGPLRYLFDMDEALKRQTVGLSSSERAGYQVLDWWIVDAKGGDPIMANRDDRRLLDDLLIVAVLPNMATDESRVSARHLVLASGHALGQQAATLLLNDPQEMSELEQRAQKSDFLFEAVYRVFAEPDAQGIRRPSGRFLLEGFQALSAADFDFQRAPTFRNWDEGPGARVINTTMPASNA